MVTCLDFDINRSGIFARGKRLYFRSDISPQLAGPSKQATGHEYTGTKADACPPGKVDALGKTHHIDRFPVGHRISTDPRFKFFSHCKHVEHLSMRNPVNRYFVSRLEIRSEMAPPTDRVAPGSLEIKARVTENILFFFETVAV